MTAHGESAIAWARAQSTNGPRMASGMCLKAVRTAFGVPAKYATAADAWAHAKVRHPGDRKPPRGAVVFWTGGSHGAGHVAISAGPVGLDGRFVVWGTDSRRLGYFDRVPLDAPEHDWGLRYAGWSEDVNDVRVYLDPWASHPNFRAAETALARASRSAKSADLRNFAATLRRQIRERLAK